MSEVLKLVKLILLVPTTNVASERSLPTLCRFKTYLQSSVTQEPVSSCSIVTTYKQQVDKLKLGEAASQFCFKNELRFSIKEQCFPRKFTENAAKGTQTPKQRCSLVETQHFMAYTNIYDIYDLHI